MSETDDIALKAAAELADILEAVAGRPLTAEERARCHQHTHMVDEMISVALVHSDDDE